MRQVQRTEILLKKDYESQRDNFRKNILQQKEVRRVHVGDYFTFLFENHDTVLYQIQEMIRAENTTGEAEIQHEISTYNELVGHQGEIGCTLLIEIEDKNLREELLSKWIGLPECIYIKTEKGQKVHAQFDERQVGERRISSVHYLRFQLGDQVPSSIGIAHPAVNLEKPLLPPQKAALLKDLLAK